MNEPRFYVREHEGYDGNIYGSANGMQFYRSFYIMDTLYNCRVVETFNVPRRRGGAWTRHARKRADQRCAQLNHWWELELQRG